MTKLTRDEADYKRRNEAFELGRKEGQSDERDRVKELVKAVRKAIPPEAYSPKAEGTAVGNLVKALTAYEEST